MVDILELVKDGLRIGFAYILIPKKAFVGRNSLQYYPNGHKKIYGYLLMCPCNTLKVLPTAGEWAWFWRAVPGFLSPQRQKSLSRRISFSIKHEIELEMRTERELSE